ncbi:MAG: GNAT family protein [Pseudomonadota bacterium]
MTANINTKPTLTDGTLVLRAAQSGDLAGRLALGNHYDIQKMFGVSERNFRPLTEEAAKAWLHDQMEQTHAWVITLEHRLIGAVRLHSIDYLDKCASLALALLDPDCRGKGIGPRSLRLVARHAFDTLQLHRLAMRVLHFNDAAMKAYAKVGFIQEGRERESCHIDGTWHDDIIMGLLAPDFRALGAA